MLGVAMARGASGSALDSRFDGFLFAAVREERGAPLSVLSALARLDLDPWQEAAALTRLPRAAAAERLALLFADSSEVAARLAALVPDGSAPSAPIRRSSGRAQAPILLTRVLVLLYIISMLALLGVPGLARGFLPPAPSPGVQGQTSAGR